ncbi:MAG: HlyD family efflux transporter periplasmic adaptor subunit [Methylovulum sp.]|uniref:efflux RND transporter periplasmic adaptor subunit n=1 Tax=Methylovulum sp. TaxID=1916980 RepID=UPI00260B6A50|nr:HlyD family efflux transporter periplasmic adaptor subunit [Methylovulum sp.]MDD2725217.1 HlyD family efflux transporter periplasmic adaptor subunit [Methylovulum sp.]MDD5126041.1 HlyD family efflux transporter periplasmic adaptor subunit [Methylovulum sp.]
MTDTEKNTHHKLKSIRKVLNGKAGRRLRQWRDRRTHRLLLVGLFAALAGMAYLAYWQQHASHFVTTNDAYVTGNVVALKAQTSGTVVDVRVDNTQYVHKGDTLVRLDGLAAKVAQEQAEANLAETVRQVETLFSAAETLRQKLAAQEAPLNRSRRDLQRYRNAAHDGAVSAQQIEDTEFTVRQLAAEVRKTHAELDGAEAMIRGVALEHNPKVRQAASALKQAYLNRVRQGIVAPVSGYIAKRGIQPGEQVYPDTPLLAIVPLDYLWIEANFLEDDLTEVQPGQPVEISVDLYGSQQVYHGEVLGLGAGTGSVFGLLPPDNATGNYIHITERVPVRISLDADELKTHPLRPGLSAVARIDTRKPGRSVLQPFTASPPDSYHTEVYDTQLDGAEALIDKIVQNNRFSVRY